MLRPRTEQPADFLYESPIYRLAAITRLSEGAGVGRRPCPVPEPSAARPGALGQRPQK